MQSPWRGTTDEWPGRAPGDYKWYELQASPGEESLAAFQSPKIIWQDLAYHSRFCFEPSGTLINDLCFCLATEDGFVLAALNSPLMWWYLSRTVIHGKDEVLRLKGIYTEAIPVPTPDGSTMPSVNDMVDHCFGVTGEMHSFEDEFLNSIARTFDLPDPDQRVISWLPLPRETFASRLSKMAEIRRPSEALTSQMRSFQEQARSRQVGLLARQLELEKRLASLVEDAYGLTAEERVLLRSTRPIRDPIDVLEAKIRGRAAANAQSPQYPR